eukprot:GHVR01040040.1.p3 GENE.GHVR01040040.1~~GHVR01040040.1.p3  ORF type:complete len:254 (-),score=55.02 GHVR01040040.1:1077-1838(-)
MADGLNAAANGLGDEGGRVDGQTEQQREEFGWQLHAPPRKLKRSSTGGSKATLAPVSSPRIVGSSTRMATDVKNTGKRLPVASRRFRAQIRKPTMAAMARARPIQTKTNCASGMGWGEEDAALIDEGVQRQFVRISDGRHGLEDGEVPEEQLQQQRNVANGLDVDRRQGGDDEIAAQAGNADGEAKHGGGDDADEGNQQRVGDTNQKGLPVGGGAAPGQHGKADIEAGCFPQEVKTGGLVLGCQIGRGIADDP